MKPKKLNIDKGTAWRIFVDVCTIVTMVVMLFVALFIVIAMAKMS